MTWRNFAYWFIFVLPVLLVAAATGSEPEEAAAEAPTLAAVWTQSHLSHFSDPLRFASLVAGAMAVVFTFYRVWQNLRPRA